MPRRWARRQPFAYLAEGKGCRHMQNVTAKCDRRACCLSTFLMPSSSVTFDFKHSIRITGLPGFLMKKSATTAGVGGRPRREGGKWSEIQKNGQKSREETGR